MELSHGLMLELYRSVMLRTRSSGRLESQRLEGGRYVSRQEMESMKQVVEGDDVDRKIRAFCYPPHSGAWKEIDGRRQELPGEPDSTP